MYCSLEQSPIRSPCVVPTGYMLMSIVASGPSPLGLGPTRRRSWFLAPYSGAESFRAQGARPQPIERKERNAVERRPLNRLRAGSLRLYHSREGQADQRTTLVGRLPELTPALPPQFKFQVCSSFMSGPARSRREKRWMRGEAWPRRKAKALPAASPPRRAGGKGRERQCRR